MTAEQEHATTAGSKAGRAGDGAAAQTFRSPLAVAIWWLWVLFAVGNLIDLAVQGRDRLSVVAVFILLLVTAVAYVTAQRPRIIAAGDGLTITNPLREHRVGWAAVTEIDSTDLVRVRCEWPAGPGSQAPGAGAAGKRVFYSWAVQTSRRRQFTAQLRAGRRRPSSRYAAGAAGGFAAPAPAEADPALAGIGDVAYVVGALRGYAEQAHAANPGQRALPPVSTWYWPAFALLALPALALVVTILALRRVRRPRPQPVHVVGRRAGLDRGVHQDGQVPRGGQAALVRVEHVEPGERVPFQGLHPDLDLAVHAERDPVPVVELLLVALWHVVKHHEDPLGGILDDGGEGALPADVLATEGQAPALQPPGALLRGVRAAREHLLRIHVAAVGGI